MNDIGCSGISIDTGEDDESDTSYGGCSYPNDQRQYCFDFRPEGDRYSDTRLRISCRCVGGESKDSVRYGRTVGFRNTDAEIQ